MINGGNATIYVTDLDRAVTFYTEVLGLRLAFRAGDHWASIDAGSGLMLGLHPASERGPAPGHSGSITVGLAVDEPLDRVVTTLAERGLTVHGPVGDEGMLKLAFFSDPDGNDLYLAETSESR
jgi:catechol 2,3-dioxygenase-like lactoylglutathione lyase family enzyme